jgi:hypothetical protein
MKTCGKVEMYLHFSSPLHYMEVSSQRQAPCSFISGERAPIINHKNKSRHYSLRQQEANYFYILFFQCLNMKDTYSIFSFVSEVI